MPERGDGDASGTLQRRGSTLLGFMTSEEKEGRRADKMQFFDSHK